MKPTYNGVSSKLAPVSIVTLWIQVVMTNCCWKQWTVVKHGPRCTSLAVLWDGYIFEKII
jgi:hypothetical protein